MLRVTICSQERAAVLLSSRTSKKDFTDVVSIGSPESKPPKGFSRHPARKLRLEFDDTERTHSWYQAPTWEDVEKIISFAYDIDPQGHLLSHCAAGVSRSSAAAWIALCAATPEPGSERLLLGHLRELFPEIWPNRRMVWMADSLLHRDRVMIEAHREAWPSWEGDPPLEDFRQLTRKGAEP